MPEQLAAIRARADAANTMVDRLCLPEHDANRRRWEMSIPARPERDPDLVISRSLDDIPALLDEIARLQSANTALMGVIEAARAWRIAFEAIADDQVDDLEADAIGPLVSAYHDTSETLSAMVAALEAER